MAWRSNSFKPEPRPVSHTPWANASPTEPPVSVTHATMVSSVDPAHNSQFHHYYKKHMTLLGLAKDLDSSDTDSETSENFQSKLFRRRQHKLKPVKTRKQLEEEELQQRKHASPWVKRCCSVAELGVNAAADPLLGNAPHHRGKRVFSQEAIAEAALAQTRKPPRGAVTPIPFLSPAERLQRRREERPYSCTLELQEGFAIEEERRQLVKAAKLQPLPPPPPPPSKHQYDPVAEEKRERAALLKEMEQRGVKPPKKHMSKRTVLKLAREVDRLAKEHVESMKLHSAVMRCVEGV